MGATPINVIANPGIWGWPDATNTGYDGVNALGGPVTLATLIANSGAGGEPGITTTGAGQLIDSRWFKSTCSVQHTGTLWSRCLFSMTNSPTDAAGNSQAVTNVRDTGGGWIGLPKAVTIRDSEQDGMDRGAGVWGSPAFEGSIMTLVRNKYHAGVRFMQNNTDGGFTSQDCYVYGMTVPSGGGGAHTEVVYFQNDGPIRVNHNTFDTNASSALFHFGNDTDVPHGIWINLTDLIMDGNLFRGGNWMSDSGSVASSYPGLHFRNGRYVLGSWTNGTFRGQGFAGTIPEFTGNVSDIDNTPLVW